MPTNLYKDTLGGFELTKLTFTSLEKLLIRHRGGRPVFFACQILTRLVGRRFISHVTVRAQPRGNAESDHNLVFRNIRLLGRIAQLV